MKDKLNKKKGMTLIEIIISMMIITIMLIPILGLVINSVKNNSSGEAKQKATLAGQQIFENIKSDIAMQELSIDSNDSEIYLNEIRLNKDGTKYKTDDAGFEYTYNGQKYKVKVLMSKNESLQPAVSLSQDYDAQYEVSGENGACTIKLIKYGSEVTGTVNQSDSVTGKTINIKQSGDRKNVDVNSISVSSKSSEKLKGKILLDFTKFNFDEAEPDKRIVVNVNNLSASDNIAVYTQKLESQKLDIEIQNDNHSVGKINAYDKEIEKSIIDGISEPWNINVKVFKEDDTTQLFNGDIIQNIKTN